jgi:hypothetical protein
VEGGDNTITRGGGGWHRDHGTAEPGSTVLVNDDGGDVAARTATITYTRPSRLGGGVGRTAAGRDGDLDGCGGQPATDTRTLTWTRWHCGAITGVESARSNTINALRRRMAS